MAKRAETCKIPCSLSLADVALHALRHVGVRSRRSELELAETAAAPGLGLVSPLVDVVRLNIRWAITAAVVFTAWWLDRVELGGAASQEAGGRGKPGPLPPTAKVWPQSTRVCPGGLCKS